MSEVDNSVTAAESPPPASDGAALQSPESIPQQIQAAREAQQQWAQLPARERVALVSAIRRIALRDAQQVSELLHQETGKPVEEALLAEGLAIADIVEYWSSTIEELLEPTAVEFDPFYFPSKRGRIERVPRGVLGLITPGNFPLAIPLRTLVPALMAGNAIVLKPSERAPQVAALMTSWFQRVLPKGLLQTVQGGAEKAKEIIQGGVDAVCFTGGEAAGRQVALLCAERLIPCALELGGKDAALVLPGAKLSRTARGVIWGAFNNSGQNCSSIERVYVHNDLAQPFLEELVAAGKALHPDLDYGEMMTREQFNHARQLLEDAVAQGAQILLGGIPAGGSLSFPPTIVRVSNETCRLQTEETFGPVLAVATVASAEEGIARINACRYGLTASVWTRRIGLAQRVARELRVGVVTINNHGLTPALPRAPWSGTKDSGYGVTNSTLSLDLLTRPFFVLVDKNGSARELWWHPYTLTLRRVGLALAKARGGAGLWGRFVAVLALLWLLPKRLLADR